MMQRTVAIESMRAVFAQCDVLATPTCGQTAPLGFDDVLNGFVTGRIMRFSFLGNLTGIPGISVPAGYSSEGLPIGFQLQAAWWQEALLLRLAAVAERVVSRRLPSVRCENVLRTAAAGKAAAAAASPESA
jgi:Asp-tRNA(Asn)/Glu-tRNA(Gln) amidotransferase A subunit family amidase